MSLTQINSSCTYESHFTFFLYCDRIYDVMSHIMTHKGIDYRKKFLITLNIIGPISFKLVDTDINIYLTKKKTCHKQNKRNVC